MLNPLSLIARAYAPHVEAISQALMLDEPREITPFPQPERDRRRRKPEHINGGHTDPQARAVATRPTSLCPCCGETPVCAGESCSSCTKTWLPESGHAFLA